MRKSVTPITCDLKLHAVPVPVASCKLPLGVPLETKWQSAHELAHQLPLARLPTTRGQLPRDGLRSGATSADDALRGCVRVDDGAYDGVPRVASVGASGGDAG